MKMILIATKELNAAMNMTCFADHLSNAMTNEWLIIRR